MGHVVGGVADVGQRPAGRAAEPLPDGQQVGEQLARVEAVGQRVDHRHRRARGQLREPLVAVGAHHDRADVAGQHPAGVDERLAPAEVGACRCRRRSGCRRGRRCRPRTTAGCAGSACRRAPRPTAARPAAGSANRSAFIAAARSSTAACSAGVRSSSRRKCLMPRRPGRQRPEPPEAPRGTRRPGRRSGSAAARAGRRPGCTGLTRKPAAAQRGGDRARDRLGEHDAEQQAGAADVRRPAGGRAPRCRGAAARRPA